MEKKFNLSSLITAVVIIGVLASFIGDLPFERIFTGTGSGGLEGFLDSLNMILMFLVLAAIIIYLFVRAGRKDLGKKERDRDE